MVPRLDGPASDIPLIDVDVPDTLNIKAAKFITVGDTGVSWVSDFRLSIHLYNRNEYIILTTVCNDHEDRMPIEDTFRIALRP